MMKKGHYRLKNCLITLGILLLLACGCTGGDDQKPLFQDNFDNSGSGWNTNQCEQSQCGYDEDGYFIELHQPNWFAWAYPGEKFDDVSVEAEAHLSSGLQGPHFGVLCRHVDVDNFYYFSISADGYYAIFRRVDGGDLKILTGNGDAMSLSPAIKTGEQTNRILAVCNGDELSIYVNGELLETVSDDTHARGDVGVGAGSGPAGDVRVQFDNFLVTRP
jgi:hypothetical protein